MDDDAGCGCGCLGLVVLCCLFWIASQFTPRKSTVIPPRWALVVTAYRQTDAGADGLARQRVAELQRAGWSSAGYRGWRSLQDNNAFWMVYVKQFDSAEEQEAFRSRHRQELHRFESVRSFSWIAETVMEPSGDYNGRVAFTIMQFGGVFIGFGILSFFLGWPIGVANGHGASEPEPRGCLASFLPGYAAGYRSGVIGAAKRAAAAEASRGDHCVARQPLWMEGDDQ